MHVLVCVFDHLNKRFSHLIEFVCLCVSSLHRYTKMKTATNIYIFNLALADSLFLATLPFQVRIYLHTRRFFLFTSVISTVPQHFSNMGMTCKKQTAHLMSLPNAVPVQDHPTNIAKPPKNCVHCLVCFQGFQGSR